MPADHASGAVSGRAVIAAAEGGRGPLRRVDRRTGMDSVPGPVTPETLHGLPARTAPELRR